ncbi:LuxR family transcriptional regulator [Bradyrhizobium sp. SYSU BS000235]|uniref:LuxR family transcriptional regulator n=1 Tax=Bradyrhizobium sp. SYSU BS000235 TaxID=3411332 RepID=UPI003C720349
MGLAMGPLHKHYFDGALDTLERIRTAEGLSALSEVLNSAFSRFGYESFCVVAAPTAGQQKFSDKLLLRKWPRGWYEQYISSDFHPHDPISNYSRSQTHSFHWSSVSIPKEDRKANGIMTISSNDYGMINGYCVPIQGLNGYQATVSIAGGEIDPQSEAHAAIDLISIFAFQRLASIRHDMNVPKVLTAREKEVISWAAVGKTAWDTSVILSISVETVNKIAASAMRKLNVHTRAQAVAESIRRREIDI